jgi:hypothetical protein
MATASRRLDPVSGRKRLVALNNPSFADVTERGRGPHRAQELQAAGGSALVRGRCCSASSLSRSATSSVEGTGIWGLKNPVGWGWAIVNFVFWVGIGHAGTLISAILFLFRQKWRTSINRSRRR